MMKKFLVKINAYGYRGETTVEAVDSVQGIEHAILDKIGKKGILLKDSMRSFAKDKCWITYEEVVDDISSRPLQEEKVVRT